MKLLRYTVGGGIALASALLLCMMVKSPIVWLITWIACVVYGLVILATIPSLIVEHRRSIQEIRRKLEL